MGWCANGGMQTYTASRPSASRTPHAVDRSGAELRAKGLRPSAPMSVAATRVTSSNPDRTCACRVATPPVPTIGYGKRGGLPGFGYHVSPMPGLSTGRTGTVPSSDDDGAGERRTMALGAAARVTAASTDVLAALVPELRKRGVRVVLATVGSSTLPVDDRVAAFPDGRFADLQRPYNRVMGWRPPICIPRGAGAAQPRRRRPRARPPGGVRAHRARGARSELPARAAHAALGPAQDPELYGNVDGGGSLWVNGSRSLSSPWRRRPCGRSASGTCTCPPRSRWTRTAARP